LRIRCSATPLNPSEICPASQRSADEVEQVLILRWIEAFKINKMRPPARETFSLPPRERSRFWMSQCSLGEISQTKRIRPEFSAALRQAKTDSG
jgi:hypothetical protein